MGVPEVVFSLLLMVLLIALTGTFMYAELQQTVSDWDRLGIIIYDHSGEV